ncbi:putative carbohydrate-binding module family 1 protein [Diaporthe ampelina]|uniref:Putative carbohydrate-binding module family 1 protein n=1 Tax=Diaporthe ampelina TaxID=1214573 RepID=A0A0G2H768_9PEZI|nr:putative carbohydrate-binding module family 1 protein [Diaporthe ampelina]
MLSWRRNILSCNEQHFCVNLTTSFDNFKPPHHDDSENLEVNNDPRHLGHEHSRLRHRHSDADDPPVGLRALATTFEATNNTHGAFAFSGDTVTWADPDVARPNTAAFYVCPGSAGENALYINTGAYLYQTPSGCYDVDIHYYGGSIATL